MFLQVNHENSHDVGIAIYDLAKEENGLLVEIKKEKAVYENLYGSHEGKDWLQQLGWNPKLEPVIEAESGTKIGTRCILL